MTTADCKLLCTGLWRGDKLVYVSEELHSSWRQNHVKISHELQGEKSEVIRALDYLKHHTPYKLIQTWRYIYFFFNLECLDMKVKTVPKYFWLKCCKYVEMRCDVISMINHLTFEALTNQLTN
jgi:hypothetical protein